MGKAIRAGVIGCGNISKFHFSGLEKAGAKIAWVCDLNEAAARPWAERFGARYTRDYREAIADSTVNLVDVTTISKVHKEICLAAIAAGKAVVCEKTLAENADDALVIARAAIRARTIFYTSYMKRFMPAVSKAKELLPEIGTVITTHLRAYQHWGDLWETTPESGFFHTPPGGASQVRKNYGGGILVCGGSHILDLVCFLLGRPTRMSASMYTPKGRDYDLRASAMMETPNGVAHFEVIAHPLDRLGFLRDGFDEQVEIVGTRGTLHVFSPLWDQVEHKASMLVHYDRATGIATEHRFAPCSPFDNALRFFCNNVRAGRQGDQSRTTGYDVDQLIATMIRSAGSTVDVKYRI
ncbi:MAG: Gfo/Idh/MocA family oxidoreductase [bacterium]